MKFEDLSQETRDWLDDLGQFRPTADAKRKTMRGVFNNPDGGNEQWYISSSNLREIAKACVETADWLDRRAEQ